MFLVQASTGTIFTIALDATNNINTDGGRGRVMQYIPGSPYLWLSATGREADADKFAYVVELNFTDWAKTKMIRKVSGIDVHGMLFVENMKLAGYHHPPSGGHLSGLVDDNSAKVDALEQELQALRSELDSVVHTTDSDNDANTNGGNTMQSINRASPVVGDGGNSDDDGGGQKALSISALVVGLLALMVSAVGFHNNNKAATTRPANTVTGGSKEGTITHHDGTSDDLEKKSDFGGSVDEYSMGSKRDQYV